MIILRLFFGLVIIFLLVAFAIRNMTPVHLDFYFYKTPDVPLFVMLYLSLLVGVAAAWILVIGEQLKMKREVRKKDKRIKELEKQLAQLEEAKQPETTTEGEDKDEGVSQGIQS